MIISKEETTELTACELVRCYRAVFGTEAGQIVLKDINLFVNDLIGATDGIIDYARPHHELAACVALNNLREYINTLTKEGE